MTGEGDGYREMVKPKSGEGVPCHVGKEMHAEKGDICRGGLALRGELSGREVLVRNSELRTVDRPVESLPSGRCPACYHRFWRTRRDGVH